MPGSSQGKPVNRGSNFWLGIGDRQKEIRTLFFAAQKEAKGKSAAQKAIDLAEMKAQALLSSSSQWHTETVFNFQVAVPALGITAGHFRRVSGLTTNEMDFETYHEGGDNGTEHYLPTYCKSGRVTLEWSLRHPDPFLIWCLTMSGGVMISQALTVTLFEKSTPKAMWIIPQCMLVKVEAPELDAMASEVATNKIELIHTGVMVVPM